MSSAQSSSSSPSSSAQFKILVLHGKGDTKVEERPPPKSFRKCGDASDKQAASLRRFANPCRKTSQRA